MVHTQSFWHTGNQNYARTLMNAGYPPQDIIDSLVANDAQGNPSIRQYGIIDLVGGGRSAGYTGVNCFDYKNHLLGPDYAIAGNILLGQQILDSMKVRFLSTTGMLSDRLMAALQGAKVPGADTRCLSGGRSSISAFIRVARPGDTTGVLFHNLNVNNAPDGVDPIDSLQVVYDEWRGGVVDIEESGSGIPSLTSLAQNFPNPFNAQTAIVYTVGSHPARPDGQESGGRSGGQLAVLKVYDVLGREVATLVNEQKEAGTHNITWDAAGLPSGMYFYRLEAGGLVQTRKLVLLR